MNRILKGTMLAAAIFLLGASSVYGQRRARPGSIKHTEAEVVNKRKITKLQCKYIRNGAVFEGPIYLTGDAGGIKIGDAVIAFHNGHYTLTFDAAKFNVKRHAYMTPEERADRGISEYEYRNAWDKKKLGQDFDYGGKYTTIEQFGKKWLILYHGDTDEEYAKIELNSVNDRSFSMNEDDIYFELKYKE